MAEYVSKFNKCRVLLVNIESIPAIESLDEILSVPDLDGVLIGPHDLSCSLGIPEQYDHPCFAEAVQKIVEKERAKNIGVGIHNLPRLDQEIRYAKAGINMILHLADMMLFRNVLREDLKSIREGLGEKTSEEKLGDTLV